MRRVFNTENAQKSTPCTKVFKSLNSTRPSTFQQYFEVKSSCFKSMSNVKAFLNNSLKKRAFSAEKNPFFIFFRFFYFFAFTFFLQPKSKKQQFVRFFFVIFYEKEQKAASLFFYFIRRHSTFFRQFFNILLVESGSSHFSVSVNRMNFYFPYII